MIILMSCNVANKQQLNLCDIVDDVDFCNNCIITFIDHQSKPDTIYWIKNSDLFLKLTRINKIKNQKDFSILVRKGQKDFRRSELFNLKELFNFGAVNKGYYSMAIDSIIPKPNSIINPNLLSTNLLPAILNKLVDSQYVVEINDYSGSYHAFSLYEKRLQKIQFDKDRKAIEDFYKSNNIKN